MDFELTANWPGKSVDGRIHPALWHMLDVGAVATHLIDRRSLTGQEAADRAAVLLVTLHDLGKFSSSFRSMILGRPYSGFRHWKHTYRLLREHDQILADAIGGSLSARKILYAAVAGHHGGPPEHLDARKQKAQARQIGNEAIGDSRKAIATVVPLFPDACIDGITEPEARRLSWLLCGLTVQADWIGSNPDWFKPQDAQIPVAVYWERALGRARRAIREAGLHQARPVADSVPRILPEGRSLRPMQVAASEIDLLDGPVLALIEDSTGSGKTEAALALASRMMAAGKADGLFFALPTMATSNAMLVRLDDIVRHQFDGRPTLALTHGRARMNEFFRRIQGRDGSDPDGRVSCGSWLADDRRRTLLADVGVGTIDQALMAILPTRFNTLRLWALSSHVLIVDEAHEFDPYMEEQLRRLLRCHAMFGGSAIIMTATLPLRMRNGYVREFQHGLGVNNPKELEDKSYPLLTVTSYGYRSPSSTPSSVRRRDIAVHRLGDVCSVIQLIQDGVQRGAACVWIRNAVDDAIAAVQSLWEVGIEAELLHARFAMHDRSARESDLLERFGRDGAGRAGRVLVATQVVEASLDLDFDLMISDLAPIGSLIQRAGRLWRHLDVRPPASRPVSGPNLHILAPNPDIIRDASWLRQILGTGSLVYPLDAQWRTARTLFDTGVIREPGGLRDMIEAVEGSDPVELPEALEHAEIETTACKMSESQLALNLVLDPEDAYDQPQMYRVFDEDQVRTRLGELQVTLRLARETGSGLVPWAGEGRHGWQASEVQISHWRYSQLPGLPQDRPEVEAVREHWAKWERSSILVAPVGQDGWICDGLKYDRRLGIVFTK